MDLALATLLTAVTGTESGIPSEETTRSPSPEPAEVDVDADDASADLSCRFSRMPVVDVHFDADRAMVIYVAPVGNMPVLTPPGCPPVDHVPPR